MDKTETNAEKILCKYKEEFRNQIKGPFSKYRDEELVYIVIDLMLRK